MEQHNDLRLIETGIPCHQIGAENQRERATSSQPATAKLHVWWARRPLTPSRAAIVASLDPGDTEPERFICQLGIERVQAMVNGIAWTITGGLLERLQYKEDKGFLRVDSLVLRALVREQEFRRDNRRLISQLVEHDSYLSQHPAIVTWKADSQGFPDPLPEEGEFLPVRRVMGNPAWFKALLALAKSANIRVPNLYG
jgi:adenine-specific DNA methylase